MARDLNRWVQNPDGTWRQKAHLRLVETEEENGDGYEEMSRDDLKAELEARGLDSTGRAKADLIERLVAADSA